MTNLDDFHEATRVFKRNDVYYLTYADNFRRNNRLQYATSSNPLGSVEVSWSLFGSY